MSFYMMNHIKKLFMWVTSATRSEGSTKSRRTKSCRDVRIIQKGALSLCKVTISYVFLLSKDEPALKKTIPWSVNLRGKVRSHREHQSREVKGCIEGRWRCKTPVKKIALISCFLLFTFYNYLLLFVFTDKRASDSQYGHRIQPNF